MFGELGILKSGKLIILETQIPQLGAQWVEFSTPIQVCKEHGFLCFSFFFFF